MKSIINFYLSALNLLKIKKIYLPQKKYFFYAETNSDWEHLDPLLNYLEKKCNKEIVRITSDINDQYINKKNAFYIGSGSIRTILFKTINAKALIMTLPEIDCYYLKKSIHKNVEYIYVFHSIFSSHRIYSEMAFDNYDTILCVGNFHLNEIKEREKRFGLKKKQLIKYGYAKFDSLFVSNGSNCINEKKILIAPTWGASSLIKEDIIFNLIDILLKNSFEVDLKLHPMTLRNNYKIYKKIKNSYQNNKKFNLRDKSNNNFFDISLMISDWSGAALEYAFTMCRPVIFIDMPPKINNKNWQNLNMPCIEDKMRSSVGIICKINKIMNIPNIINYNLSKDILDEWKNKIMITREETIFNLGKAGQDCNDSIKNL